MKIILQKPVEKLGVPGDLVEVKDGYARNFLFPRGLAVQASKGTVRHAESLRSAQERRSTKAKAAAEDLAGSLKSLPILIRMKAGEDGKLFGSVTTADIASEIEAAAADGTPIDKHWVHIDEPIKSTGAHPVTLRLHPDVEVEVTVEVQAEA